MQPPGRGKACPGESLGGTWRRGDMREPIFAGDSQVLALVQFDGNRSVIEISGHIGLYLSYVIDPINPKMRAMTWNFYDASARYATLLT
jgi:hypothetical protein